MEVISIKALKCILDHFDQQYSQEEKRYVCGTNKIALCAACTLRRATIYTGLHKFHGRLAKSALAICVTATLNPREPHLEFIIVAILLKFPSPWHAQASYCWFRCIVYSILGRLCRSLPLYLSQAWHSQRSTHQVIWRIRAYHPRRGSGIGFLVMERRLFLSMGRKLVSGNVHRIQLRDLTDFPATTVKRSQRPSQPPAGPRLHQMVTRIPSASETTTEPQP